MLVEIPIWPAPAVLTVSSGIGYRKQFDDIHKGWDIPTPLHTTLITPESSDILYSNSDPNNHAGLGIMIVLQSKNYRYNFWHLGVLRKTSGRLAQGEDFALSGNTGAITTGPHTHFQMTTAGAPRFTFIDPADAFPEDITRLINFRYRIKERDAQDSTQKQIINLLQYAKETIEERGLS